MQAPSSARRLVALALFAALAGAGCPQREPPPGEAPTPGSVGQAPPADLVRLAIDDLEGGDRAAFDRGRAATDELQRRLGARLQQAMQEGGPLAAIEVCGREAQALTQGLVEERGFDLGRTSHRLRNAAANTPRPWVAGWLAKHSATDDVEAAVYDLGDHMGVIRPIVTAPLCLPCHGDPKAQPEDLRAAIAARYPADQAVGYEAGQLRGVFWAEVPRR